MYIFDFMRPALFKIKFIELHFSRQLPHDAVTAKLSNRNHLGFFCNYKFVNNFCFEIQILFFSNGIILEDSWDVVDDSKVQECVSFNDCSVTCGGGEQQCNNICDNNESHFGGPGCPLAKMFRRRSGCFGHDCRKGMTQIPEDSYL